MTSVNSPACLLARNRFYRNVPPGPDQMKPAFGCKNPSVRHKQRQVTLCVTMATPPGFPGSKGLWVGLALSTSSLHFFTSKPTRPADRRGVK